MSTTIITSRKNLHILCFGENSIHKEVRSRQQFLREIFNRNNVDIAKRQVLLLVMIVVDIIEVMNYS